MRGGVNVSIDIQQDIQLPSDSRAVVSRSLLGEASVEFIRGTETDSLNPGDQVTGVAAADPLVMIQRLETRTLETLSAFGETTQEWQQVAININNLMDTKRGNLDQVVERAADSLHEFTVTMRSANHMITAANKIVADPANQQAMKDSLIALPKLVNATGETINEIRRTIASTGEVLDSMKTNLDHLSKVTEPVGKRGEHMVANIDQLLTDLNRFIRVINQKDGSLQQFISNPSLYNNLDRTSQQMAILMKHLEPVAKDLREFGDKVARNPELLGVGGAVRPSKGLKDEEILDTKKQSTAARTSNARGNNPK